MEITERRRRDSVEVRIGRCEGRKIFGVSSGYKGAISSWKLQEGRIE